MTRRHRITIDITEHRSGGASVVAVDQRGRRVTGTATGKRQTLMMIGCLVHDVLDGDGWRPRSVTMLRLAEMRSLRQAMEEAPEAALRRLRAELHANPVPAVEGQQVAVRLALIPGAAVDVYQAGLVLAPRAPLGKTCAALVRLARGRTVEERLTVTDWDMIKLELALRQQGIDLQAADFRDYLVGGGMAVLSDEAADRLGCGAADRRR